MAFPYQSGMTVLRIVPLLHQFEHGLFVRSVQVGLANASGFVPQTFGHYVENTGDTDLVFLEMFKAPRFQDISLNGWLTTFRPNWSWSIWKFRSRRFRRSRAPTMRCCRPSGRVDILSSLRTKQSNRYP
jgi:hypothetical protein